MSAALLINGLALGAIIGVTTIVAGTGPTNWRYWAIVALVIAANWTGRLAP